MKNLKLSKTLLSLITTGTIAFSMSGCGNQENNDVPTCTHLIVTEHNITTIYKECDGYDIVTETSNGSWDDDFHFGFYDDNGERIFGIATVNGGVSIYNVTADQEDDWEEIQQFMLDNGAYVYDGKSGLEETRTTYLQRKK